MITVVKETTPHNRDWTRAEFMRIAATIEEITGISFPLNRRASAEAVMRKVMARFSMTNPVSLEIGVSQKGTVLEALLDDLTIGESYFFREPAQLRFVADELLPKWGAEWDASHNLRVWSAGCAAGQEPYSIAMMLRDAGWRHRSTILATDISEARLEVARKATFSKWSLRTLSQERIDRWFERTGSAYQLSPEIRADVDFKALNLLDLTPRPETQNQQVIFCRNVLIYFELPAIVTIAERLLQSLAPDGWLFLGASDPQLADITACEVVVLPGCTAYRRTSGARSTYALRHAPLTLIIPDESSETHSAQVDIPASVAEPVPYTPKEAAVAAESAHEVSSSVARTDEASEAVSRARSLANEGRLKEAGEVCTAALERFPDQSQLHLIAAILHGEANRWAESERAARRALYLDRSLALAHIALGDALANKGDAVSARRSFENAAALLETTDSAAIADHADVSVARLTDIVRAHLSMLDRSPRQTHSPSIRASAR